MARKSEADSENGAEEWLCASSIDFYRSVEAVPKSQAHGNCRTNAYLTSSYYSSSNNMTLLLLFM